MSQRDMWKTVHLLYLNQKGPEGVPYSALERAGISCYSDTVEELEHSGVLRRVKDSGLVLSNAARKMLQISIFGNRRWTGPDLWVDYPEAFVAIPYSETWSDSVYREMIEPAVTEARVKCVRGDAIVRVGDLTQNIWALILHAGIVIADISVLNANVFYELGLTHALGKDTILLKRRDTPLPADFGGAHYYEYDLNDFADGKNQLRHAVENWVQNNKADGVRELRGS